MSQKSNESAVQKLSRGLFQVISERFAPGIKLTRSAFEQEVARTTLGLTQVLEKYRLSNHLDPADILKAYHLVERKFEVTYLVPVQLRCNIFDSPGNLARLLRLIADIEGDLIFIHGGYPSAIGSAELSIIFDVERSRNLEEIVRKLDGISDRIFDPASLMIEAKSWAMVYSNEEALRTTVTPFRHQRNGKYRAIEQAIEDRPGSLAAELRRLADYYSVKSILGYRLHNGSASISIQIEPAQDLRKSEG